jgi:Tol biopolymer transport system component
VKLLAPLAVAAAALVFAAPASATYPGRNGPIAYVRDSGSEDPTQPRSEAHALMAQPWGGGNAHALLECVLTGGVQSSGDCSIVHIESPAYSRDGRLIAFDAGRQIGIVSTSGGPVTLLSAQSDDDGHPAFVPAAWVPGAPRISFTATNDRGGTDILMRRVDGRGKAALLRYDATEPAWSARGDFAFVRDGNVYLRAHDNPHHRFVTSGISPDWSPDSKRLVVVRPRPNLVFAAPFGRLYTVRPNGRGLRQVLGASTYAGHPVWSPDGRWIAYDGLDLGVYVKRLGTRADAREIAPTQFSGSSGYVDSYQPTWRARR